MISSHYLSQCSPRSQWVNTHHCEIWFNVIFISAQVIIVLYLQWCHWQSHWHLFWPAPSRHFVIMSDTSCLCDPALHSLKCLYDWQVALWWYAHQLQSAYQNSRCEFSMAPCGTPWGHAIDQTLGAFYVPNQPWGLCSWTSANLLTTTMMYYMWWLSAHCGYCATAVATAVCHWEWLAENWMDGFMSDHCICNGFTMEIPQSCTKPSKWQVYENGIGNYDVMYYIFIS